MMKSNFNTAWALKKPFAAGVEVTAQLPLNADTDNDLLMYRYMLTYSYALLKLIFVK